MEIVVNGRFAVMNAGTGFEYCSENRYFSEADGYTLTIDFPMEAAENVRIFGHVNRMDVVKDPELMACEIRHGNFVKHGSLAVTEVTDTMVKAQFLEGVNPEEETLLIDTLYVNEMDLGSYPVSRSEDISPEDARKGTEKEVCYPWVPVGYDVVNNHAESATEWDEETVWLSWQPMLKVIVERIIECAGYRSEIGNLWETYWKDAVICNTLPSTWEMPAYASALPRWTVREWFDNLGLFVGGVFEFDETKKEVTFAFYRDVVEKMGIVEIKDVVDEFSSTLTRDEEDADYLPIKRYMYKDPGHVVWKYWSAPWIHKGGWVISEYDSLADYEAAVKPDANGHRHGGAQFIHLRDLDTTFCFRRVQLYSKGHVSDAVAEKYPYGSYYELMPVDILSPPDYDEDLDYEELGFNPVILDYALEGKMMFLPVTPTDDSSTVTDGMTFDYGDGIKLSDGVMLSDRLATSQTRIEHAVENHSDDDSNEYFSEVLIGIRDPEVRQYPLVDVDVYARTIRSTKKFMRLGVGGAGGVAIDPRVKHVFSFVAYSLPDVRSRFLIHGQLYVAQRITVTFDERGMQPIMKGEFFRVM